MLIISLLWHIIRVGVGGQESSDTDHFLTRQYPRNLPLQDGWLTEKTDMVWLTEDHLCIKALKVMDSMWHTYISYISQKEDISLLTTGLTSGFHQSKDPIKFPWFLKWGNQLEIFEFVRLE